MSLTIKEISAILDGNPSSEFLEEIRSDQRAGVQKLIARFDKKMAFLTEKQREFEKRFTIENSLINDYPLIAGIDEVGRGPLAGPVISAAVILKPDFNLIDVNDSKQLTDNQRQKLFVKIIEQSLAIGIGIKDREVIDQINIYEATKLAMRDAVNHLNLRPDFLLVDAMDIPIEIPQRKLIKGDAKSNSIAAASIVAKVIRDQLMDAYDQVYPGYGFSRNAGYGTKVHLEGLNDLGVTPIHRRSFKPISDLIK